MMEMNQHDTFILTCLCLALFVLGWEWWYGDRWP